MQKPKHGSSQMAKKDGSTAGDPTTQPVPPASTIDDRHRLVTLDTNYGDKAGTKMKRADFIRDCWSRLQWTRGTITKEINRLNGLSGDKPVKYQIVFAATKGVPGGPPQQAAAPAAPAVAS
jgi:hypothetical protein